MQKKVLFLFVIIFSSMTNIEAQNVKYEIRIPNPKNHYAEVLIQTIANEKGNVKISMPVWTPGSYLIREFAKNIESVSCDINNSSIQVNKVDKNTWSFPTKKGDKISFRYKVYCFELSVRTSFIDEDQALLNMASVCMFIEGQEKKPGELTIVSPEGWNSFTSPLQGVSSEPIKNTLNDIFITFENYDELIDSPVQLGNFQIFEFEVSNIKHHVALVGKNNANIEKLKLDMQRICQTMTNIIGIHPCKSYTFIIQNVEAGGGGLEHKNGSTLMMSRFGYSIPSSYQGLLGLVAHEYFHLWNVKRIRPIALGPFDYNNENYTKSLWIAEGITSYYDELALMRAGYVSRQDFLNTLMTYINNHENRAGSKIATLHEMSWDAWIKEYRPSENSKNNSYSYYSKGLIIGALLDMTISKATNGKKSLDDVYKALYNDFYLNTKKGKVKEGMGYTDDDFLNVCNKLAGVDLSADFNKWLASTESPDYSSIFKNLELDIKKVEANKFNWGLNYELSNGKTIVKYVRNQGPALDLGINVNDEIISINGVRVNNDLESTWLKLGKPDNIEIIINRAGLLRTLTGRFIGFSEIEYTILLNSNQKTNEYWLSEGAVQKWLKVTK
jgi:predicted metalloprotease with PDZ domain